METAALEVLGASLFVDAEVWGSRWGHPERTLAGLLAL
jgi:hypothetical protein